MAGMFTLVKYPALGRRILKKHITFYYLVKRKGSYSLATFIIIYVLLLRAVKLKIIFPEQTEFIIWDHPDIFQLGFVVWQPIKYICKTKQSARAILVV